MAQLRTTGKATGVAHPLLLQAPQHFENAPKTEGLMTLQPSIWDLGVSLRRLYGISVQWETESWMVVGSQATNCDLLKNAVVMLLHR